MFSGFTEETIQFFLDLRFHNEVGYFNDNRDRYEKVVKEPFYSLIEALAPTMTTISEDIETRPLKCLARIRRDIRFTKDKSPFRDHLWFLFRRANEQKEDSVAYYVELSPSHLSWGIGFWGQNRKAMDALRRRIDTTPSVVEEAFHKCDIPNKHFQLQGDKYKRKLPPNECSPLLTGLYGLKSLHIVRVDAPFKLCYQKKLVKAIGDDFKKLAPLYNFMRSIADEGIATNL